jgi:pSer/pThr/pTyr-binding forkhead associated (FHA) protein
VLGRGRAADVRLGDGLASRRHARLTRAGAHWLVHDLGSKNGVRVNGRRAAAGGALLSPGDRVAMGASLLLFEAPPGEAEAPRSERAPPAASARRRAIIVAVLAALATALAVAA